MTEKTGTTTQTPMKYGCVFKPAKDNPTAAEKFVRDVFKSKPTNIDLIAAELAPLYGLGPNSSYDPLARSRAQAVFKSPQIINPLREFLQYFVRDQWGVATPNWETTLALVRKHRENKFNLRPIVPVTGTPEQHYARFIIRMLETLENPSGEGSHMLLWLGDGIRAEREDDVSWILFYTLLCFHLQAMELNKSNAPKKVVAAYYFDKFFNQVSKFVSARKGAGDSSPLP
ncbi:hypothetical protein F4803DRAFT_548749 [Xylaria telfairii]|nr:hypothetical protein F4803DRAFT_548749 [Xylaria telfairii]